MNHRNMHKRCVLSTQPIYTMVVTEQAIAMHP